jgi:hypothetical protein
MKNKLYNSIHFEKGLGHRQYDKIDAILSNCYLPANKKLMSAWNLLFHFSVIKIFHQLFLLILRLVVH